MAWSRAMTAGGAGSEGWDASVTPAARPQLAAEALVGPEGQGLVRLEHGEEGADGASAAAYQMPRYHASAVTSEELLPWRLTPKGRQARSQLAGELRRELPQEELDELDLAGPDTLTAEGVH